MLPRRQALVALLGDGSDKAQLRQSHSAAPSSSGGRHAALQRDREAAGYAVAVSPRSDSLPLAHLAQQTMLRYFTSYLQLCSNLVHTQVSPSMSAHPPLASHGALVPSASHMHSPCVASAHMFKTQPASGVTEHTRRRMLLRIPGRWGAAAPSIPSAAW